MKSALLIVALLLGMAGGYASGNESGSASAPDQPHLMLSTGHDKTVDYLARSEDGRLVFSAEGHFLRVWERATGRQLKELRLEHEIVEMMIAPGRDVLVIATNGELVRFSIANLEILPRSGASRAHLRSLMHAPDFDNYYGIQFGYLHQIDLSSGRSEALNNQGRPMLMADGTPPPLTRLPEQTRLFPGEFEIIIIATPNQLFHYNTDFGHIEKMVSLPERGHFDFADLDHETFLGVRNVAVSADLVEIEWVVFAKRDLEPIGKLRVPNAHQFGNPSPQLPYPNALTATSGRLLTYSTREVFEVTRDGDELTLHRREGINGEGRKRFALLKQMLSLPSVAGLPEGLLLGGSEIVHRQGGIPDEAFLFEWRDGTSFANRNTYGDNPLKPQHLWAHPSRDEFFVANEHGVMRRVELGPEGLRVSRVPGIHQRVAFSPSGGFFVADGSGKGLQLQRMDGLRQTHEWPDPENVGPATILSGYDDTVVSSDGEWLGMLGSTRVGILSLKDRAQTHVHRHGHFSNTNLSGGGGQIDISADGGRAIFTSMPQGERVGQAEPMVVLMDMESGQEVWRFRANYVSGLRFLGDSTVAFTSGRNAYLRLDAWTGEQLGRSSTGLTKRGQVRDAPAVVAYSRDRGRVAIGANDRVVVLESGTGEVQLRLPELGVEVISLAFFANSDYLLIGSEDNRIHLWQLATGGQLVQMALFLNDDEWVLHTPGFLFQSSVEAATRLHFVHGSRSLALASLYEQFHTPRLLDRLLGGEILSPLIPVNALRPAPEVTVSLTDRHGKPLDAEPPEGGEIRVHVQARSSDSPVSEIRLYHNQKLVSARQRGLVVELDEAPEATAQHTRQRSYAIGLLDGVNELRAVAINEQRTESEPVSVIVDGRGAVERAGGLRLHLLVVGIDEYANSQYNLNYAVADAMAFADGLAKGAMPIVGRVESTILLNGETRRDAILRAFEVVVEQADPRDIFVFYFAGHGVMSSGVEPEFYLVPPDVTQLYGNDEQLALRAISASELRDLAARIPAQKQLFVIDACQSAGALRTVAMRGAAEERALAQLARSTGTYWLAASGSEQFAAEFATLGHGAFTYAILEALRGVATGADEALTVRALDAFLQRRVPELTREHRGTPQFPASFGFGQDFPLSLIVTP